jgi:hypothetical protein
MRKIIEFKTLPNEKLFLKYSDGMEGKISLKKLVKHDEFETLLKADKFEDMHIDENSGDIILNGNIELCKNAMYGILELRKQMANLGLPMDD